MCTARGLRERSEFGDSAARLWISRDYAGGISLRPGAAAGRVTTPVSHDVHADVARALFIISDAGIFHLFFLG